MKKLVAMLLSLCMILALFAGCGGQTSPADSSAGGGQTSPADSSASDEQKAPAENPGSDTDPSTLPPYKIGMITPLTGPGAYGGVEYKNGAELAVKHLGDTINGRKIELVVADGFSADSSISEFERLYDNGVRMFSSGYGSLADNGALALADELKVLYMGMSWSPDLNCAGSEYFFRLGTIATAFGADCVNYAVVIGEQYLNKSAEELKIAIVYNTSQTPIANAVSAKAEELNVQVTLYEGYAQDTQDFVPTITKLMNTDYDIFIPVQSTSDGAAFQKKMFELGYTPSVTLAAGIYYDLPVFAELGNEITDGVMTLCFVNPTAPESACPGITKFVEDYKETYGYEPLTHALMAYCQVMTQYKLLESVDPADWDDTSILAAKFRETDVGVGEMPWYRGILFNENNENVRAHENMVCQWQGGELKAILPDALATTDARIPWAG